MHAGQVISLSPSFNSFSDSKLVGIAARVVGELDPDEFQDFERRENSIYQRESDADGGDDFDFAFVTRDSEPSCQIPADEIFQNGKIRPVYPVFDSGLLLHGDRPRIRHPLRNLFIEETVTTTTSSSTSSTEADEMDRAAEGRWKKSASAGGGSKRWKLKSLLHRSHSYGSKDSSVVVTQPNSARKKEQDERKTKQTPLDGGKFKSAPSNRDGGEKLRSYLPYRLDLVGLFGNVNGLRKT